MVLYLFKTFAITFHVPSKSCLCSIMHAHTTDLTVVGKL